MSLMSLGPLRTPLMILLPAILLALSSETMWGQDNDGTFMTLTTRNVPTGTPREWENSGVTIDLNTTTRTLTVTGYFVSLDPDPDPTQELKLVFRNFNGPRDYPFSGADAEWENRNTGDGICHYKTGKGTIDEYDLVNNQLSGSFDFTCESKPQVGAAYKTNITGHFVVTLEPSIFAPAGGETMAPLEQRMIEWELPGRDEITVAYTLENDPQRPGADLHFIAEKIDADQGSVTWEVPDTMAPHAYIVILDAASDEIIAASQEFRLRAPLLARITTDPDGPCPDCPYYEEFTPAVHAWNFRNTQSNFDPFLRSDGDRFKYESAEDPVTGEPYPLYMLLPPISADEIFYPEWPNWVSTFGIINCYTDVESVKLPGPPALTAWAYIAKEGIGGACYGMAYGAGFAFVDKDALVQFVPPFGSAAATEQLFDVELTNDVKDAISTLYGYQFTSMGQAISRGRRESVRPMDVVGALKESLIDDELGLFGSNVITILEPEGEKEERGAHALLAYEIFEEEDNPEILIYVYDPNYPGDDNSAIVVNSETNTWSYELSGSITWSGQVGIFLDQSYSDLRIMPQLDLVDPAFLIMFSNPGMEVDARGSGGGGFDYSSESGFEATDPAARPLFQASGPGDPYGFEFGHEPYVLDVTAADGSGIGVSLFAERLTFTYRSDAVDSQTDRISWDDEGLTITNTGATPRTIYFDALFDLDEGSRTIAITGLELAGGDSIRFEVVEEEDLRAINYGDATSYEITIRQITRDGFDEGSYDPVDLGAGETQTIAPVWWNLGTRLPIIVDPAGGGASDTLYLLNHLMGVAEGETSNVTGIRIATPLPDLSTMTMTLEQAGTLRIDAHDALGTNVATLFEGRRAKGTLEIPIDASRLAPGYYILHITVDGRSAGSASVMRVR